MNTSKLIDMFGLSGDPENDDRLDDLLFRLESDTSTASGGVSGDRASLPFYITITRPGFLVRGCLIETLNEEKEVVSDPRLRIH